MVNETDEEILVFVYGAPPKEAGADVIDERRLTRPRAAVYDRR